MPCPPLPLNGHTCPPAPCPCVYDPAAEEELWSLAPRLILAGFDPKRIGLSVSTSRREGTIYAIPRGGPGSTWREDHIIGRGPTWPDAFAALRRRLERGR